MRILILSNLYPPLAIGGYERACANVSAGLVERGHDVRVLTSWSHLPGTKDPPYVHRQLDLRWFVPYQHTAPKAHEAQLHESLCSGFANSLRLIETLRAFEPDLVYVWNLFGVGVAGLVDVLNQTGVPWALHLMDCLPAYFHDNVAPFVRDVFNARGAAFWERATIIAMSEHVLEEILARTQIRFHQGVELIPGWVDLSGRLPHLPYRRDGIARFVTAGQITEHKGIGLIIEACRHLKARGIGNFVVDLFGEGEIAAGVDLAKSVEVDDVVRFCGPSSQPDLLRAYAEHDAFLFPTWEREPFGFAPVEAAGCGTPPIMTRNCGAAERLVDRVHCIKIERTSGELADAMAGVIDGSLDVVQLGRNASLLVESDLSFSLCLARIERVLEGMPKRWDRSRLDDLKLELLTFVKHNLSLSLRFG